MIRALSLLLLLGAPPAPTPEPAWQRHASPVADDLHDVFFLDDAHGWIVAHQSGAVLRTADGGATWSVQARLEPGFLESVRFVDARMGWICGDRGRLYRTMDGGAIWETLRVGGEGLSLYGIRLLDARRGFLTGVEVDPGAMRGVLFETADGGATWTRREDLPPVRGLTDTLAFPTSATGFAGGMGALLATRDGGRTWTAHDLSGGVVRGLWLVDGRMGWAVGHDGFVLRTRDGGESWERRPAFTANRLRSVRFVGAGRGFVAGDANKEPGVLFTTADGGETWQRVEVDAPDLHRLGASPSRLWAVGKGGTILSRRLHRLAHD